MKIGILSDTHSKVKKAKESLDILSENGAEFIVHAGDIGEFETLELLKNCKRSYVAVYGNNDAHLLKYHNQYNLVQEPYYFKVADTTFKLMHLPFYMAPDADVVIYGHTHVFKSEFLNETLFLNPGESCARDTSVSECVMLEILENEFLVTYYSKKKKDDFFSAKSFAYKRKRE